MSFDSHLERLDAIVAQLQRDDVPLEQALALYEEGVGRVREASAELARAEAQVRQLVERPDGTFEVTALDG